MNFRKPLILSLGLHFLLMLIINFMPVLPDDSKNEVVEVEFISPPPMAKKSNSKQIVREVQVPEDLRKENSDDLARFLSANTVRVKKEVRAATNGRTENRSTQKASEQPTNQKEQSTKQDISLYEQGLAIKKELQEWKPQPTTRSQREFGLSTVGESLPENVTVGSFTALNSDRYAFYTFFARIEDQIRFRWENEISAAIDRLRMSELTGARTEWVTHVQILLKPNGEFHSAAVMKESGIRSFDTAPISAFREAKMFPHPPKEMVGENGLIKLDYSFLVRFDPRAIALRRSQNSTN